MSRATQTYRPEPSYATARTSHGALDVSTADLMRPGNYSRARTLTRWPDRLSAAFAHAQVKDGVATIHARTSAVHGQRADFTLRAEVGVRAFVALTGRATPHKAKHGRRPSEAVVVVREAVKRKADGGRPVVLTDHDMMVALGIKTVGEQVGYLE